MDVLAVMDKARAAIDVSASGVKFDSRLVASASAELYEARAAVAQLKQDVGTALEILANEGSEDSPLAAFLRGALARFGGAQ